MLGTIGRPRAGVGDGDGDASRGAGVVDGRRVGSGPARHLITGLELGAGFGIALVAPVLAERVGRIRSRRVDPHWRRRGRRLAWRSIAGRR